MTSTRSALWVLLVLSGCGLERPPDPPPFDCASVDRAAERFPDECGEDSGVVEDAGDQDADQDAGT